MAIVSDLLYFSVGEQDISNWNEVGRKKIDIIFFSLLLAGVMELVILFPLINFINFIWFDRNGVRETR